MPFSLLLWNTNFYFSKDSRSAHRNEVLFLGLHSHSAMGSALSTFWRTHTLFSNQVVLLVACFPPGIILTSPSPFTQSPVYPGGSVQAPFPTESLSWLDQAQWRLPPLHSCHNLCACVVCVPRYLTQVWLPHSNLLISAWRPGIMTLDT